MSRRPALVLLLALSLATPAAAAERKKGGGETFIQLPPLAAIAFRPGGRNGVFTVEAGLDVKDEALRLRALGLVPRLRDAYVVAVQSYSRGLPPGGAPDADRLALQLQRETDRVLGKPGAKILLGTVLVN